MKKISVNSPEYRDIVKKLLGKEVKFENLPAISIPTSPSISSNLPQISSTRSSPKQKANNSKPQSKIPVNVSPPAPKVVKQQTFTGIKDVDLLILKELDDEDLFSLCQVDKYINNLCNNESFWLNKLLKKYPDYKLLKMEATNKDIYKELYQLEKLKTEFNLKQSIYGLKYINLNDQYVKDLDELKEFPKYLTNLQTVEYINLSYNQISEIPDLNLPNLEELILNDNNIKILPTLNLPKLKELHIGNNKISKILKQDLPNLWKLDLKGNRLKTLPILNLPKLQVINLQHNEITKIAEQNWPELFSIDILHTKIKKKDLPSNIAKRVERHNVYHEK